MSATSEKAAFSSIEALAAAWPTLEGALGTLGRQAKERRRRHIDDALSCGIPNTRQEEWKYTSLRPLLDSSFGLVKPVQNSVLPNDELSRFLQSRLATGGLPLVFVDGQLIHKLPGFSPEDSRLVKSLEDIERTEDPSWWDRWLPALDSSRIFWKICFGFSTNGLVLKIPKNHSEQRPFHVIHIHTGQNTSTAAHCRILLDVEDGASVRVIEEFLTWTDRAEKMQGWDNSVMQIKLGSAARCGYYRIIDTPGCFHTGGLSVRMDHDSHFDGFSLVTAGRLVRLEADVQHMATGSQCTLNGLTLGNQDTHVDHHTAVDHRVGHTRTNQLFKGILADSARLVFNGKIYIRKQAQKSEAYQTCKNLLLSDMAEANAKPQLEIDADDVKASHGAAIGSINPQELFYLQSRSIGEAEAIAMLCRGFADDVMMRVEDPSIREAMMARVSAWFQRQSAAGKNQGES